MEETFAQVDGLYQGDQQYWDVLGVQELTGIFLVLVFAIEILKIAELCLDIFGKFYFDKGKFLT